MSENSPVVDLAVGRSSVGQRILALLMDESSGRLHLREIQSRRGHVAMLRLAKACLDVEGSRRPRPCRVRGLRAAFRSRRGMYSAYFRRLLDAADLRKAAGSDIAAPIDYEAAATAVERAEVFRDAATRFVARSARWSL